MRTAGDGTADAAMVRMQQENVHLRTTAERTAAELRHLRDSRRAEPDRASLGRPDVLTTVPLLRKLPSVGHGLASFSQEVVLVPQTLQRWRAKSAPRSRQRRTRWPTRTLCGQHYTKPRRRTGICMRSCACGPRVTMLRMPLQGKTIYHLFRALRSSKCAVLCFDTRAVMTGIMTNTRRHRRNQL